MPVTGLCLVLCDYWQGPKCANATMGGGVRVGRGVHDSYAFQCGLVGSFTSPGIDT